MAVITDEQRANLAKNPRFQDLAKIAIQNTAGVMAANNGDATPGGMTRVEWAKQRFIAYSVKQFPNNQDYAAWYFQMTALLKDQDVWNTDEETTITNLNFAPLAEQTFGIRAQEIKF